MTTLPVPSTSGPLDSARGEQFCDVGRGITLCYQTFGDPANPPLLLIMGLGMQMVGWDDDFCAELAGRGFHVVRFDNRDAGLSTFVDARVPTLRQIAARRFGSRQYDLSDMALDTAELLRRLNLAPAHVVGASMGGMIAQTLAAEHPERVRSLTSIMSTTGSRRAGQPSFAVYRYLFRRAPREREAYIDHIGRLFGVIGSPGFELDFDAVRGRAARAFDRNHDPRGTGRQLAAIVASGDRTPLLRSIKAPTLVIHGAKDRMVAASGGRATARAIPGARLVTIDGMGHDLPRGVWPRIVDEVGRHAAVADRAAAPARSAA